MPNTAQDEVQGFVGQLPVDKIFTAKDVQVGLPNCSHGAISGAMHRLKTFGIIKIQEIKRTGEKGKLTEFYKRVKDCSAELPLRRKRRKSKKSEGGGH